MDEGAYQATHSPWGHKSQTWLNDDLYMVRYLCQSQSPNLCLLTLSPLVAINLLSATVCSFQVLISSKHIWKYLER